MTLAATPISLLKSQLNLDHDRDDALLDLKLAAAESWIGRYVGSHFEPLRSEMVEAALQLAAYWYEQREAASFATTTAAIPFGVHDLLEGLRRPVTGRQMFRSPFNTTYPEPTDTPAEGEEP